MSTDINRRYIAGVSDVLLAQISLKTNLKSAVISTSYFSVGLKVDRRACKLFEPFVLGEMFAERLMILICLACV